MRLHLETSARAPGRDFPERGGDHQPEDVLGSWSATRWCYTTRETPVRSTDVVCELGGIVTLSLSPGRYILAWDIPKLGHRSTGGQWAARGDSLHFLADGGDAADSVTFRRHADILSLSSPDSAWNFGEAGNEVPAAFVAVFLKL